MFFNTLCCRNASSKKRVPGHSSGQHAAGALGLAGYPLRPLRQLQFRRGFRQLSQLGSWKDGEDEYRGNNGCFDEVLLWRGSSTTNIQFRRHSGSSRVDSGMQFSLTQNSIIALVTTVQLLLVRPCCKKCCGFKPLNKLFQHFGLKNYQCYHFEPNYNWNCNITFWKFDFFLKWDFLWNFKTLWQLLIAVHLKPRS